jgi:hypothetical protein
MLNTTRQTFDPLRFDFLIDETLKLYLMEVNLSPNITPEHPKYEKNAKFREQMVHDALKLVGAGSYFDMMYRLVRFYLISLDDFAISIRFLFQLRSEIK